jgi:hypothetical protein
VIPALLLKEPPAHADLGELEFQGHRNKVKLPALAAKMEVIYQYHLIPSLSPVTVSQKSYVKTLRLVHHDKFNDEYE